jgi:MYXO-CTERM domain-containing protein
MAFAFAISSHAQVFSLTPTADALLSAANPTLNYGGAGALAISAAGLPKGEFDSLLQFNFAAAKSSFDAFYGAGLWTIQSITLTLTATPPGNALFNGNLAGPGGSNINFAGQFSLEWIQNDAWTEGTGIPQTPTTNGVTYNDLTTVLSGVEETVGTFAFSGATTGSTAYNLALTPSFTADATAGNVVSFFAAPADTAVSALVNARSVMATASRPTLTIIAVPEPASAAFALSGLLMLAGVRRRS